MQLVRTQQEELDRRYEESLVLASHWLDESSTHTQDELARRIGTDAGSLCRYLGRDPHSEPTPRRPAKLAILEGIERICVTPSDLEVNPEDPSLTPKSTVDFDAELYREIRSRVINMIKNTPSPRGLAFAGGLTAAAAASAERYRPTNCQNVALAVAEQLAARHACISNSLVMRGVTMLRLLLEAASGVEGADHRIFQLCRNYVGRGLVAAGRRLGDAKLRREGLDLLHDSVRLLPDSKAGDQVWVNYLDEVEVLAKEADEDAHEWSEKARRLAEAQKGSDQTLNRLVRKGLYSSILSFSLSVILAVLVLGPSISEYSRSKNPTAESTGETMSNGKWSLNRSRFGCGGGSVNNLPRFTAGGSVNQSRAVCGGGSVNNQLQRRSWT